MPPSALIEAGIKDASSLGTHTPAARAGSLHLHTCFYCALGRVFGLVGCYSQIFVLFDIIYAVLWVPDFPLMDTSLPY